VTGARAFFPAGNVAVRDPWYSAAGGTVASSREQDSLDAAGESDAFDDLLKQVAQVDHVSRTSARPLLRQGSQLYGGRFEIVRRLGEGGMGVVYEAFDRDRRHKVALKTLFRLDASGIYRLKQEFRALSGVAHPNLVALYELFAEAELWFFTMELIEGRDLVAALRDAGGAIDDARLRDAFAQLARGVQAIHASGKLHRDLKPSNVLLAEDGRVVILDFGLAVDPELGGVGQTLSDGSVSGTPSYMAPEQAAGRPATEASDWYAVGVMLFEALTGELPFQGSSREVLARKQRDPFPSVASVASGAASDLDRLCTQLCQREPAARASGAHLLGALARESTVPTTREPVRKQATTLFGRDAELRELLDAYAAAEAGEPSVVLLSGESGMGKSALAEAFADDLRARTHAVVLGGRCYERESVPYKAFDSVIDELSRHLRRLGPESKALLPRDVAELARLFPVLDRVESVAEAPARKVRSAQEQQRRAYAAFEELLGRIRDRQPLVIHIDDMQWADADSVALLCRLLDRAETPSALWLLGYRAEEATRNPLLASLIASVHAYSSVRVRALALGPLAPDAAQAFARSLLGDEQRAVELAATVAREGAGSPFFVASLARYAASRHAAPIAALSLSQALLGRIDALPEPQRALLEIVALASRPIEISRALEAAGSSAADYRAFDELSALHMVRLSGPQSERRIETYHDRIRETVVAALRPEQLQALHLRLAQALGTRSLADAEELAAHLEGAGEIERAAEQLGLAADQAARALAFERAARLYARALELGGFAPAHKRELRHKLGDALANAGRGVEAADAYLSAVAGAPLETAQELRRLAAEQLMLSGRVAAGFEIVATMLAELDLAPLSTAQSATAALAFQRVLLRVRGLRYRLRPESSIDRITLQRLDVYWACARALGLIDQVGGALYAARFLRLALRTGEPRRLAYGMLYDAGFFGGFGDLARAHVLITEATALIGDSADPYLQGMLAYARGVNALFRASFVEAVAELSAANATYREQCTGCAWEITSTRMFDSCSRWFLGQYAALAESLPQIVEDAERRGELLASVTASTGMFVCAWLSRGDVETAALLQRRARERWPAFSYDLQHCFILIGESLIGFYRGDAFEPWRRFCDEARKLAHAPSMRIQFVRMLVHAARAGAALLAARAAPPAERAALVREAERSAREVGTVTGPLCAGYTPLLRAALACARGARANAMRELEAAIPELDRFQLAMHAAAARRRLGVLRGDDTGRELIERAEAAMRAEGVIDPERMTAALTPACDIP
jgi:serine/threonine protein kinase